MFPNAVSPNEAERGKWKSTYGMPSINPKTQQISFPTGMVGMEGEALRLLAIDRWTPRDSIIIDMDQPEFQALERYRTTQMLLKRDESLRSLVNESLRSLVKPPKSMEAFAAEAVKQIRAMKPTDFPSPAIYESMKQIAIWRGACQTMGGITGNYDGNAAYRVWRLSKLLDPIQDRAFSIIHNHFDGIPLGERGYLDKRYKMVASALIALRPRPPKKTNEWPLEKHRPLANTPGDIVLAPMTIHEDPLTQDMTSEHVRWKTGEFGAPKYLHRILTDGLAFREKRRQMSGTVLIDISGSMHPNWETVRQIARESSATMVAVYGETEHTAEAEGKLVVIAKGGKVTDQFDTMRDRYEFSGGNHVDINALQWLTAQPGPLIWVSDGGISCKDGDPHPYKNHLLAEHHITQIGDLDDAVTLLKTNAQKFSKL